MSVPLTINGAVFNYPVDFDTNWGIEATGWAQAVTSGMLQKAGGSFPLTAAVDFGTAFGMLVKSVTSKTTNPATAGYLSLAKTDAIEWRNNANSGNLSLAIDGSDNITFNGSPLSLTSLADGKIFVGNVSNVPVAVFLSGDATITNTGVLTIANTAVTNAKLASNAVTNVKVDAAAAIAVTKLAAQTAHRAATFDASGFLTPSTTTDTELGYSSGVTSAIQTQLNARLQLSGGTMSGAIAMGSNKITGLANGTVSADAMAYGQNHVFQIVSATNTTSTATTSTSFVNTSLTASITPSSTSNKVRITVSTVVNITTTERATYGINRGGTDLQAAGMTELAGSVNISVPVSIVYVDSPAVTSSLTYTVRLKSTSATTVTDNPQNNVTTIVLEEII